MLTILDEKAMLDFGKRLYERLPKKCVVFLHGDLGAGKTTLVRGFLQSAGHHGAVKSPTYNLVEEYAIDTRKYFHFDLYRLVDAEELEWIGIRDYFNQTAVSFIEWPEMGQGFLPESDLVIEIQIQETMRQIDISGKLSKKIVLA